MIRLLKETGILLVLSAVLTIGFYFVVGAPDRTVPCDQENLEPNHICLDTVLGDWAGEVQWVDARKRSDWKKNGLEGSVLLTDDPEEDFNELIAEAMEAIFMASQEDRKVVIYCNGVACGSSKAVHAKLIEQGIYDQIYILHGGWKALEQDARLETL